MAVVRSPRQTYFYEAAGKGDLGSLMEKMEELK